MGTVSEVRFEPRPRGKHVYRDGAAVAAVFAVSWVLARWANTSHQLHVHFPSPWVGDFFVATAAACLALILLLARSHGQLRAELRANHIVNQRLIRSEQEARAAEAQARLLLESTSEGIYALNPEGRFLWLNPAAVRMLGFRSASELIGRDSHATIHHTRPDGSPFPAEECRGIYDLRKVGNVAQPQELLWRADGSSFYAEIRVNPMWRDGELMGGVVVFRDLTERVRLEEQYRQAHKMEAVGRLAAGVAHDFNNLLTVINGYAELMRSEPGLDPAQSRRLAGIARAGRRAAELVRQLLAYSRHGVSEMRLLPLNDTLRAAVASMREILGAQCEIELELAGDLAPVRTDSHQMEEVVMNLVSNARDAMPAGGLLTIRTANVLLDSEAARAQRLPPGTYGLLEIRDSGAGMNEETRKHLFEPFFSTKPPSQGAGLGLAMALDVIRQCGGSIAVDSAPGRGTSVRIYLPTQPAMPANILV